MMTVSGWNTDACQTQTLILPDGSSIGLTLYYSANQYSWFIQNLTYGNFQAQNLRMVTSPNILQQFMNQIPFGLACFTTDGLDSTQQQDLFSGYATLYILSSDEVEEVLEILNGSG
jgi:hypothetical protein